MLHTFSFPHPPALPAWALAACLATAVAPALAAPLASEVVSAPAATGWSSADAVVEAVRDTAVAAQVAGAVVQLRVQVGDKVQAGQELLRLDAQAAQQTAAASSAQVQAARSQAQLAVQELARQRQLLAKNYISQAAFDRAQAQHDAAQAEVRALQAQAGAASAQTQFYVVRAPYAGVVSEVPVALGDMATPGRTLLRLYDPRALRITATAAQSQVLALPAQGSVALEIPGLGSTRVPLDMAQLERLPTVDARSHTMQLRAHLPAALQAQARPGMFARLWLPGADKAQAPVSVPQSAIWRRAEMTGLFVLDAQGQPRLRQVRLGRALPAAADGAARVEVLSGLRSGERIATDPQAAAQVQ